MLCFIWLGVAAPILTPPVLCAFCHGKQDWNEQVFLCVGRARGGENGASKVRERLSILPEREQDQDSNKGYRDSCVNAKHLVFS